MYLKLRRRPVQPIHSSLSAECAKNLVCSQDQCDLPSRRRSAAAISEFNCFQWQLPAFGQSTDNRAYTFIFLVENGVSNQQKSASGHLNL